jgi:type III secretion protein J
MMLRTLLIATLALLLAGCKVELYSGLTEPEANEILAALGGEHIAATKERLDNNEWQVQTDEAQLSMALAVLRAQGLPKARTTTMGDVFQKQGLVSTPSEERMRYIFAVSQELSQTLRSVDGVVDARVHVVVPANDPLNDKVRPSSAAVFIKYRPDTDVRLLAPTIKDLVAHSIEGLNHDQVSLSLFEARRAPATATATAGAVVGPASMGPLLSDRAATVLVVLLVLAAACVAALPTLLKRQGLDWRTWARRQLVKR